MMCIILFNPLYFISNSAYWLGQYSTFIYVYVCNFSAAMDALMFLNNTTINLNNLFSVDGQTTTQVNCNVVITALGNVLEKQVRTWWDIFTLEHYIKEKMIIRSLRWEVAPQDGLDDTESMQEWLDFFIGVGFKFQELILQRKKKKMINLETRINNLQLQLDPH